MYACDGVRHLHLELTTRCNAQCPMCARNVRGATAPNLEKIELALDDFESMFPDPFLAQLTGFDICGAYGDPAAARDLIGIVATFRAANPTATMTIYTNGGLRSTSWWRRLCAAMGSPSLVIFAIDGLEDTNAIHRRGVDFGKVIANARAFIEAGGDARWEYLVFRHNEHQLDDARRLSVELGFREFSVKRSARFLEPTYDHIAELDGGEDIERFPIHDAGGAVVGHLEPPRDPTLQNTTWRNFAQVVDRHGSLDALFSRTTIRCRVLDSRSVFVSAQGLAFPCCWTYVQATRALFSGFGERGDLQVAALVRETGGFDALDVRTQGLRSAIDSPFFSAVAASWGCSSVSEGRLRVCARACGVDFPAYFDQVIDPALLPRGLQPNSTSSADHR